MLCLRQGTLKLSETDAHTDPGLHTVDRKGVCITGPKDTQILCQMSDRRPNSSTKLSCNPKVNSSVHLPCGVPEPLEHSEEDWRHLMRVTKPKC